jgi:small subunit ribosomal protein S20
MAHHKAQKKSIKKSRKANIANRAKTSTIRTTIRKLIAATKKDEAEKLKISLFSLADKAAQQQLIHKKKAGHLKSRAARLVNALGKTEAKA